MGRSRGSMASGKTTSVGHQKGFRSGMNASERVGIAGYHGQRIKLIRKKEEKNEESSEM